jgi:hypothetical protein
MLLLVAAGVGVWGVLALAISGPGGEAARYTLAGIFGAVSVAAMLASVIGRWEWRAFGAQAALFMLVLVWWHALAPSNDRAWKANVAVLPYATVSGDQVTVHNIRNFDYRTENDFTPAYYDKRFDVSKLEGVDLVAVYWMGPAIAHVFLSFAFEGDQHLAVSIETRTEKTEGYSTLNGFFRQYELAYVVADERDVIRLRTNYRKDPPEQVHIYRMSAPIENGRKLFMAYMDKINSLRSQPEFYNSLTTNCTTSIWLDSFVNKGHVPFSWKILASGYVPEYLFEQGRLQTYGLPFAELQGRALVNARAQAADKAADFSRRIRAQTVGSP